MGVRGIKRKWRLHGDTIKEERWEMESIMGAVMRGVLVEGGSEEGFLSWPRCSELSPGEMQVGVPRSRPAPWTMEQCSLRVKQSLQ